MSLRTRTLVIANLCILFSLLSWQALRPFVDRHVFQQQRIDLLDDILLNPLADELPEAQRAQLLHAQKQLHSTPPTSLSRDLHTLTHTLLFGIPPLLQGLLFFGIAVSFLLLFHIQGAAAAAWLLPILAVTYALHNNALPTTPPTAEERLWPSEHYLTTHYLTAPLSPSISEQQKQLSQAWELYLVTEWAHLTPSPPEHPQQLARGLFQFQVARSQALNSQISPTTPKPSFFAHALLCLWTVVFASGVCWRVGVGRCPTPREGAPPPSNPRWGNSSPQTPRSS